MDQLALGTDRRDGWKVDKPNKSQYKRCEMKFWALTVIENYTEKIVFCLPFGRFPFSYRALSFWAHEDGQEAVASLWRTWIFIQNDTQIWSLNKLAKFLVEILCSCWENAKPLRDYYFAALVLCNNYLYMALHRWVSNE